MLQKLKALFTAPSVSGPELERCLQLAAAALMIELSKADYKRDEREQQAIVRAVRDSFQLDDATLHEIIAEAETMSSSATSLYEFTSLINLHCSDTEKYELIRNLWQVAHADGNIDKYEDHLIRKVAELLYVPHQQFIRAKLEVVGGL